MGAANPTMVADTRRQLFRYALVGIGSNVILYLVYLLLTSLGLGHKTAMTLVYLLGLVQTFIFNRQWTFEHRGAAQGALLRYLLVYLLGYLVNFAGLYALVDVAGFAHQLIQALMIMLVAALQFLLLRQWVFARAGSAEELAAGSDGR